jgi:hypothetical protein
MGKHAVSVPIAAILCIAGCAVADEPQEGSAAKALRSIDPSRADADYLRRVVGRELIRHRSRRDPPGEKTTPTGGGQCWYSARTDIHGCP